MKLSDVREIFRILGDARDLRHDPEAQEKLIVDEMVRILDADFGHALRYDNFRPNKKAVITHTVFGSTQDPYVMSYIRQWGRSRYVHTDPIKPHAWKHRGPVCTISRSMFLTYQELRPYRLFTDMIEPARLNDAIMTFFRYPGTDQTRGYTFIRTLDKKEFNARELRLAHLLIRELRPLCINGVLEPVNIFSLLPGRLADISRDLTTGLSQKQIAEKRHLSYETVRSYTKQLYGRLGVSSREALMAKLMTPPRTDTSCN